MNSSRRQFLNSALAGIGVAAAPVLSADRRLDPAIIGANPCFPGYGLYRPIGILHGLGFQTIELHPMGSPDARAGMPPGFEFDRMTDANKKRMKEALQPFRYVSTHLAWVDTPYCSPFGPSHEYGVSRIDTALETSVFVGAEVAKIHVQRSMHISLEQAWPVLISTFRRWGDIARGHRFRLAIETGYPDSVADFVRLIHQIEHEHVGATIDVGRQKNYTELIEKVTPRDRGTPQGVRAYNDVTHDIIDRLGPKVFHVHDIEPNTWADHKPLVHGFVDYPRLIAKLRSIHCRGLLVLEIGGPVEELSEYFRDAKAKLEDYVAG